MSLSKFKVFQDAGLTIPMTEPLEFVHNNDGSTPQIDRVVYIGSAVGSATLQTKLNPLVDNIIISITDANPAAGTPKALDLKLASSFLGLDTAIASNSLSLGVKIEGGVANSSPLYIRATVPEGLGLDLTLQTNELAEIF